MAKVSNKYLEVDPFKIIEKGFHADRNEVSESIFSLSNEYMGVRGTFEEGSSLPSLLGTYFNGIYEYALEDTPNAYLGIIKRTHFTINSVNFFKCVIEVEDEQLDLGKSKFTNFVRTLDMHSGLLTREFVWKTKKGDIKIKFERLLDMVKCHNAVQKITFLSENKVDVKLTMSLDNNVLHWRSDCYWKQVSSFVDQNIFGLSAKTLSTRQALTAAMVIDSNFDPVAFSKKSGEVSVLYKFELNGEESFTRYVNVAVDKKSDANIDSLVKDCKNGVIEEKNLGFSNILHSNTKHFDNVWENSDIEIVGNDEDQQGIRYCIFQLEQNYHGFEEDNNIGAKGLTGEAYSGHAFWDSETYCLPYYLFNNKKAALNLLMFRYNTLEKAKERAKMLDCIGACYPIATRNGEEGCNLWQHASCQFQPTTGVGYAIYHYMNLYNDHEFMQNYGLEMMIEICKFLLSRGQWNGDYSGFGYYGVMGPDEFQLMVNNNTYTNFMAKKMFEYLFVLLEDKSYKTDELLKRCGVSDEMLHKMKDAMNKMIILFDKKIKIYEQHEGFFKLPHIDINSIPVTDFPLYSHWSYDRIYRNDIVKQPDVLMFMFLYPSDFSIEEKKANYEYYEPRCLHESSLSPSIHSIFATELGKEEEALKFFGFATRLDLDDYNRNTKEGLHMTSLAAAWVNIIYGFMGLKSDRNILSIAPKIPEKWQKYTAKLNYLGRNLVVEVSKDKCKFMLKGEPLTMLVYGKKVEIKNGLEIAK